nr:Ubiquitin-associated and SH3 domain-containing protein [Ipomoea batatas]
MNAGCLFPVKTFQQTSLKKRLFRAIAPRFYITHTKRAASLKSASNSSLTASASAYRSPSPKMEISGPEKKEQVYQYIVVMRHGDRLDNVDPLWITQSERPWDPPLHQQGKTRAFTIGQRLRQTLGAPINRVFVSPFLRCLQTASEAVRALCTVADPNHVSSDAVSVDLSKIKVSIEIGLCEMLNRQAIRANVAPKDGDFKFNISECEAQLPTGTIDHSAERVYEKLPEWEESAPAARARYMEVVKALADKYPSENLLLVTHGEGVGSVFSDIMNGVTVYDVEYCGYTILKRCIHLGENQSFTAGELTQQSEFGIKFLAAADE